MELLDYANRTIDTEELQGSVNRVTNALTELADGFAVVESFSHVWIVQTGEGLVLFDASGDHTGPKVVEAVRRWSTEPVHTIVYTHGHIDHVGGAAAWVSDAETRGHRRPRFVAHENVQRRLDRYRLTNGYNVAINLRQFGPSRRMAIGSETRTFVPAGTPDPDEMYRDEMPLEVGGERFVLHHAKGETDDHLWSWFPDKKWVATGDFVIWNFPNAGNPQKVQRWPIEWAQTLRRIAAKEPELLLPAHGLPIAGQERIARVLNEIAAALENLVSDVVAMMNNGATLDEIIHTVRVPAQTLALPYLRPLYDEPEFVVRGVWRQFGGWWDGAPSRLKPAPDAQVGAEIARLSGGADVLARRAMELAESGELRLACHLADFAGWAEPDNPEVHEVRAAVYEIRRKHETSLMAKGIFKGAARESERIVDKG